MLRHPAGNAFSQLQLQAIDGFGMRILGGPQDKFVAFEHVDKTGVAADDGGREVHHFRQHFREWNRRGHSAGHAMQDR